MEPGAGRTSAPAERVARIVELVAAQPERRFTLSQIVDELDLSISTVHSILVTLTARGWLVRRPADKTYALGPTLSAAARAAKNAIPGLVEVEAAVDRLSAQLDAVCAASTIDDDDVVIVAQCKPAGIDDPATRVGQRVPFGAPFGACFVAWAPTEQIDAWLERSALGISPTERALYQRVFDGIRERGYGIERLDGARTRLHDALVEFRDETLSAHLLDRLRDVLPLITVRELLPEELAAATEFDVAMVHSPVFGRDGHALYNITVHVRRPQVALDEIRDTGKLVVEAAQRCTASIAER